MIQRIQTVYLFIAFISIVAFYFLPIGTFNFEEGKQITLSLYNTPWIEFKELSINTYAALGRFFLELTLILSAIVSLFTIFGYKKRKSQIRKCNITMTLLLIFGLLYVAEVYITNAQIGGAFHTTWGCVLPFAAFFFLHMGKRAIQHDEELIRSAERIR